jgi:hypothetical protein
VHICRTDDDSGIRPGNHCGNGRLSLFTHKPHILTMKTTDRPIGSLLPTDTSQSKHWAGSLARHSTAMAHPRHWILDSTRCRASIQIHLEIKALAACMLHCGQSASQNSQLLTSTHGVCPFFFSFFFFCSLSLAGCFSGNHFRLFFFGGGGGFAWRCGTETSWEGGELST